MDKDWRWFFHTFSKWCLKFCRWSWSQHVQNIKLSDQLLNASDWLFVAGDRWGLAFFLYSHEIFFFLSIRYSLSTQEIAVLLKMLIYTWSYYKSQHHIRSILDCIKSVVSKESLGGWMDGGWTDGQLSILWTCNCFQLIGYMRNYTSMWHSFNTPSNTMMQLKLKQYNIKE